jgi:outer membrane biosynthesis protein TonB
MSGSDEKKSTLKSCLEESNNDRMKNYVKILDDPGITTFEWIHRTQEELMDGIVYLEKLKDLLSMNMRELDAARMESIKRNKKEEEEGEDIKMTEIIEENEVSKKPEEEKKVKKRKVKVKKEKEKET